MDAEKVGFREALDEIGPDQCIVLAMQKDSYDILIYSNFDAETLGPLLVEVARRHEAIRKEVKKTMEFLDKVAKALKSEEKCGPNFWAR